MELMEIKPVSSREFLNRIKAVGCLKWILVVILAFFIGMISTGIFEFIGFFLRIRLPFSEEALCLGWFGFLLVVLPRVFDYFLVNYLNNTTYRIYEDRINYISYFPVFVETDINLSDISEISAWKTDEYVNSDIGVLILSIKNSGRFPMFLVPDIDEVRALIRELY